MITATLEGVVEEQEQEKENGVLSKNNDKNKKMRSITIDYKPIQKKS